MDWTKLLQAEKTETAVSSPFRSAFERDYDRIVFSAPFRNLQDKTQVFPLPEDDFVHTRLTHSLEVASVGRSLGKSVGEILIKTNPRLTSLGITPYDFAAIVSAAALTHDIGNPPFGHAGENAISDFFRFHEWGNAWKPLVSEQEWQDLVDFEGNAQGFRMLVDKSNGLRISSATLAAFTKYPRPSFISNALPGRKSQKKYGFFVDQLATYRHLAKELGLKAVGEYTWVRHPLAFLVEAADDICYSIIDLEDGCTLGLVSMEETISLLAGIIGERFSPKKLQEYKSKKQKLSILRAMAIQQLVTETVEAFRTKEEDMLTGLFDQALTDTLPSTSVLGEISALSVKKIYRSQPVLEKEAAGFQVLEGVLEVFSRALYHKFHDSSRFSGQDRSILRLLPEGFPLGEDVSPYFRLRALMDFISGMTDKYALLLYRRVKGISIPGS
nr:dNTP triphosphohydrolase [Pleomorphovibrio marinus]